MASSRDPNAARPMENTSDRRNCPRSSPIDLSQRGAYPSVQGQFILSKGQNICPKISVRDNYFVQNDNAATCSKGLSNADFYFTTVMASSSCANLFACLDLLRSNRSARMVAKSEQLSFQLNSQCEYSFRRYRGSRHNLAGAGILCAESQRCCPVPI